MNLVRRTATQLANALEHAALAGRQDAEALRVAANQLQALAEQARDEALTAGEAAAKDEQRAKGLQESLEKAQSEERLLREQGILQAGDTSVQDALTRLIREEAATHTSIAEAAQKQEDARRQHGEVRLLRETAEHDRSTIANELAVLKEVGKLANSRRAALEGDAAMLRLLQTDKVDVRGRLHWSNGQGL